jgi:AcrR family transcriptional regulator
MIEEKERILKTAQEIFLKEGFYKTTIDDLAAKLRVSKKTIYKYFESKDELVKETVFDFLQTNSRNIKQLLNADEDSIILMTRLIEYLGGLSLNLNEKWLTDLQTHYQDLWIEIDKFRTKMMNANLSKLIKLGQGEGYIINLPSDFIVALFQSAIRGVINPDYLINSKFSAREALDMSLQILIGGILTPKGETAFKKLNLGE